MITSAKVTVEPFWPGLFAKALEGRNIGDLITNVGSAPAAGAAPAAAAGGAGMYSNMNLFCYYRVSSVLK